MDWPGRVSKQRATFVFLLSPSRRPRLSLLLPVSSRSLCAVSPSLLTFVPSALGWPRLSKIASYLCYPSLSLAFHIPSLSRAGLAFATFPQQRDCRKPIPKHSAAPPIPTTFCLLQFQKLRLLICCPETQARRPRLLFLSSSHFGPSIVRSRVGPGAPTP